MEVSWLNGWEAHENARRLEPRRIDPEPLRPKHSIRDQTEARSLMRWQALDTSCNAGTGAEQLAATRYIWIKDAAAAVTTVSAEAAARRGVVIKQVVEAL